MRKLKHHEKKLLKKVDFFDWKQDKGHRDVSVMRRYHVQNRDEYRYYNVIIGDIKRFAHKLSQLDPNDKFRRHYEILVLEKLYDMGVLASKSQVSSIENDLTVSAFCRRRIGVVMVNLRMAQNIPTAVRFVEQGHVRIGPSIIRNSAYLVPRSMESYLTWVDSSAIKRKIMKYNDQLDDFDLL